MRSMHYLEKKTGNPNNTINMKTISQFILKLVSLSAIIMPNTVFSAEIGVSIPQENNKEFTGGSYGEYIGATYSFALKAGIGLTVLMIIYAGYRYMTSQGNPSAINEAKDIIIGSLSGFSLLLLVHMIISILDLPISY